MSNLIPEDWERESQKDSVYLYECIRALQLEIMRKIELEHRKEARIEIIQQPEKIEDNDEHKILPF